MITLREYLGSLVRVECARINEYFGAVKVVILLMKLRGMVTGKRVLIVKK